MERITPPDKPIQRATLARFAGSSSWADTMAAHGWTRRWSRESRRRDPCIRPPCIRSPGKHFQDSGTTQNPGYVNSDKWMGVSSLAMDTGSARLRLGERRNKKPAATHKKDIPDMGGAGMGGVSERHSVTRELPKACRLWNSSPGKIRTHPRPSQPRSASSSEKQKVECPRWNSRSVCGRIYEACERLKFPLLFAANHRGRELFNSAQFCAAWI